MDEETLKEELVNDNILNETSKRLLLEYIENKDEIKNILNQEINDSLCKCFTGRLSRLVNVLNGYSDLVSITISDSEQKNMIMSIGIRTYENREELENYIRQEFETRGFDDVEEWIGYLN